MSHLAAQIAEVAQREQFSGVVRVDRDGDTLVEVAFGMADRANGIAMRSDTVLATASVAKGFTALVVLRLVEEGALPLHTTARSLLGGDLPLVADDVTVEHLLTHRSGIGDYFDENLTEHIDDFVLQVPVHRLDRIEAYLQVLDGHPTAFPAGTQFAYCNGGFVVLALLAERATGRSYFDLVDELVCRPAGLANTSFLRSDSTPAGAARHYLDADGLRTNVLHMPVVGGGDGGVHTTVADLHTLWGALFAGSVVQPDTLTAMTTACSDVPAMKAHYGRGCWLSAASDAVFLEGYDAGVSARSVHQPSTATTCTVLSNTSEGAWPMVKLLMGELHL